MAFDGFVNQLILTPIYRLTCKATQQGRGQPWPSSPRWIHWWRARPSRWSNLPAARRRSGPARFHSCSKSHRPSWTTRGMLHPPSWDWVSHRLRPALPCRAAHWRSEWNWTQLGYLGPPALPLQPVAATPTHWGAATRVGAANCSSRQTETRRLFCSFWKNDNCIWFPLSIGILNLFCRKLWYFERQRGKPQSLIDCARVLHLLSAQLW